MCVLPANHQFKAVSPQPKLYTVIVEQILEAIERGAFDADGSLPSERQLAESFATSRVSLREAVRVLEHSGVLEVRPGRGIYLARRGESRAAALRARAAVAGEHSPLDLMTVRAHTDPLAAELAAQHGNTRDIEAIHQNLQQHRELIDTLDETGPEAIWRTSRHFHIAVAEASHNGVLIEMQHRFLELIEQRTWKWMRDVQQLSAEEERDGLRHHELVAEAIASGDPAASRAAMSSHISESLDVLREATESGHDSDPSSES